MAEHVIKTSGKKCLWVEERHGALNPNQATTWPYVRLDVSFTNELEENNWESPIYSRPGQYGALRQTMGRSGSPEKPVNVVLGYGIRKPGASDQFLDIRKFAVYDGAC